MVAVLTAVVLMLITCHSPRTVINLYESYSIGQCTLHCIETAETFFANCN